MASPVPVQESSQFSTDNDTDYGSELEISPDEELRLLTGTGQPSEQTDDNPIVTEEEQHDPEQTLRLPRVVRRESQSPLFQAVRDAERIAEQINDSVASREHYPNCNVIFLWVCDDSD